MISTCFWGINWTPYKIEWYVDGVVYNTPHFSDPTNSANDKRLKAAAKVGFESGHNISNLNLATEVTGLRYAGDYLAKDGTELKSGLG